VHGIRIDDEPEKTAEIARNAAKLFLADLGVRCGFF
jgi:hypothetical protein